MNFTDLNALTEVDLVAIAAKTSTVTGTGVDISAYEGQLKVTQNVGTTSGTTPTLDGKLQISPDNSNNWTDISGATFIQATAAGKQSISVDVRAAGSAYAGGKYLRYVGTIAGTTPSFTMGVYFTGAKKRLGSL